MSESTIGIDVSKKELVVALLQNKQICKGKFSNDKNGFNKLDKWIIKNNATEAKICMEATGCYSFLISNYLYEKNYKVYVVNPFSIKSFANVKLSRTKTDEADAIIIAEYIKMVDCIKYTPKSNLMHEIKYMYRCLDDLKNHLSQAKNYLESKDLLPKEVIKIWKSMAKSIETKITTLEAKIVKIINNDSELTQKYNNLLTVPGISIKTAIALLAEIPDITHFKNARQLAAFAGLTPKQTQSGTSVKGRTRLSKTGSSKLRKAIFLPAIVAKQFNPIIIKFCQNLEHKGKCKMVIVGAAMRKLVHIIFGVLKNNIPFNPNIMTT